MKLRRASGLFIATLALTALTAAPAAAAEYSLDTVSARMMSTSQASSLGVAGNHIREFIELTGTKDNPDDFWLCDLTAGKQVEVEGSPTVYVVAYASAKSRIETVAEQEYNTFRRVGTFVQVVSLEIAGPNAPKLTSSHIKGVNGLTRTLGANWAW